MTAADALIERHVRVPGGAAVLFMNCAENVHAALSVAHDAARSIITDRSYPAVVAALRELGGVANAEVQLAHGTAGIDADFAADVVVIRTPREKVAALQLLADAFRVLRIGGRCYVVGATTDGVKSVAKLGGRIFGGAEVLAHDSSHRIVELRKSTPAPVDPAALDNPFLDHDAFHVIEAQLRGESVTLYSRPGVFSWEHVDEATALLADVMPVEAGEAVLDLGCGSGALGIVAAQLSRTGRVVMVDADIEAVRSARRGADAAGLANVAVLPSDVASAVLHEQFDVVVTNPPFHAGSRAADLDLPRRFISDARAILVTGGRLVMVANRTLPYERQLLEQFGNLRTLHESARFKVVLSTKPATPR